MANVNARRVEEILTSGITAGHYVAGSNITITENQDGTETISSPGGGGGGGGFTPTETQLAAMNSGIDSTKVAQIETNKNNISNVQTSLAVGSSDNGKVLTASYSGGTGSYAWVTPSGGGAAVNNATITIQKNGTTVDSFTSNQATDKTINITVPTSAADVSALPDTTKYAAALSLTIDSSTFVVTGQLKDQNGDNLGTAQTIDLPLESVVVGGSYNSQTQKVVLTLQNGNTVEFSIADLVSGLQTELSASNKLNPAYINYDSTHRAVSDTEKSTWNGKQNAIDSSHKLSADLVDDTNATNKFATAEELEQIQTNKNNISFAVEKIGNNLVNLPSGSGVRWVDVTVNIPPGVYIFGFSNLSGDDSRPSQVSFYGTDYRVDANINKGNDVYINNVTFTDTITTIRIYASTNSTTSIDQNVIFTTLFLCKQETWNPSVGIQPYAMSNAELTAAIQALQAQLANQ